MLKNKLVKMKREVFLYKLTLMIDPNIVELLKTYAKEHRLTMSCIVENLLYNSLKEEKDKPNNI